MWGYECTCATDRMFRHGIEERRLHERSVTLLRRPACFRARRVALVQGWRAGVLRPWDHRRICAFAHWSLRTQQCEPVHARMKKTAP